MNFDNLYQGLNPNFVIWYGQAYQALLQLTTENIETTAQFSTAVSAVNIKILRNERAYRSIYSGSTTLENFLRERINRGLSKQD